MTTSFDHATQFLGHSPTRARSAARELLGGFQGLLITDRYSVYDFIDPTRRQICLAHLARNCQAFAERDGACGAHGQQIRTVIDEVIRADTQARADGATLAWHTAPLNDIHDRLMDAVEAGERSHTPTCPGCARPSWTSGRPCGTSPSTPARRRRTTEPSERYATPCSGAKRATAPRPKRATDSSNGSSQSAKRAASTNNPYTATRSTSTPRGSPASQSRLHSSRDYKRPDQGAPPDPPRPGGLNAYGQASPSRAKSPPETQGT